MNLDEAYRDDTKLNQRAAIWRWATPKRDLFAEAVAAVEWRGDEVVLDVGCGNGKFLRAAPATVRTVGIDRSAGMLVAAADAGAPLVRGLAEALPVRTGSVDVGLALHMLYHVPDIPAAVAELRRVVRPGGVVLVSTLGRDNMAELRSLVATPPLRFTLESAPLLLEAAFDSVELIRWRGELVVPDVETVVAYVDSLRPTVEADLTEARRRVTAAIESSGAWRCGTDVCVFRCR